MTRNDPASTDPTIGSAPHSASGADSSLLLGLEQAGLTRNEAIIYLYLLRTGRETGASKIAQATSIHRQYVYVTLEKLVGAGLVLTLPSGARNKYKAMPPSAIERFARKKFDAAGETAQALTRISGLGNEQEFEIYMGDRQVKDYEADFMTHLTEGESQYVISGGSKNFLSYFHDEYEGLAALGKKKKLSTFYIGGKHEAEDLAYAQKMNPLFQYRVLDGIPDGVTSTVVRHGSVIIYSLAKPPLIYVIHSQVASEEYKAYFDVLWRLGK